MTTAAAGGDSPSNSENRLGAGKPPGFAKRQVRRFWAARANRWLVAVASLWQFAISIPYLFFSKEVWGPTWFYLAQPFSEWLKQVYESGGVVAYVAAITFLSGLMGLATLFCLWWTGYHTVHRYRRWKERRTASRG